MKLERPPTPGSRDWYYEDRTLGHVRLPVGNPSWFRDRDPPQPRRPRLTALLAQNAAARRAKAKRAARRKLVEVMCPVCNAPYSVALGCDCNGGTRP